MELRRLLCATVNYNSSFSDEYRKDYKMKYLIIFIIVVTVGTQSWIIKVQADHNNRLIYDLNVSQTAFKIQSNLIADGLCLPEL